MRKRRKKRGRPATGQDPLVSLRLPVKLVCDIDAWAGVYGEDYRAFAKPFLGGASLKESKQGKGWTFECCLGLGVDGATLN